MLHTSDLDKLNKLEEDVKAAFLVAYEEMSKTLSSDTIVGCALTTSEGAMGIYPSFMTKSFYEHYPDTLFELSEWPIIQEGGDAEFNAVSDSCAKYMLGSTDSAEVVKNQIVNLMTSVLSKVREELGVAADCLFMVGVSGGVDPWAKEHFKRLNSPEMYERYMEEVSPGEED